MVTVKICGLKTYDDALACARVGADMLGFNFYSGSPRFVEVDAAMELCDKLRDALGHDCPVLVGIFVNESVANISVITSKVGLDAAQLSGDESDSMLKELRGIAYKGIQPINQVVALDDVSYFSSVFPENEKLPSLLLDAYHPDLYGGTGDQTPDEIAIAVRERVPRLMLAGGLNPENVAKEIAMVQPWGVDVASGVEVEGQLGVKDLARVQVFIEAAKR